jgi:hypothetical protein
MSAAYSENPMLMYRNVDLNAVSFKANDCTARVTINIIYVSFEILNTIFKTHYYTNLNHVFLELICRTVAKYT